MIRSLLTWLVFCADWEGLVCDVWAAADGTRAFAMRFVFNESDQIFGTGNSPLADKGFALPRLPVTTVQPSESICEGIMTGNFKFDHFASGWKLPMNDLERLKFWLEMQSHCICCLYHAWHCSLSLPLRRYDYIICERYGSPKGFKFLINSASFRIISSLINIEE